MTSFMIATDYYCYHKWSHAQFAHLYLTLVHYKGQSVLYLSLFIKYFQMKYVLPWFDLYNLPRSNTNMSIKRSYYMTFYITAVVMFFHICHHLRYICSLNVHDLDLDRDLDLDLDLWNSPRSKLELPIKRPHMLPNLMTIVMFTISVITYKIFANEESQMFNLEQDQSHEWDKLD